LIQHLVEVDFSKCDALAQILASTTIPEDHEDTSLSGFAPNEIGNFYLFLVAICHQTQSLMGKVDGCYYRGWDY